MYTKFLFLLIYILNIYSHGLSIKEYYDNLYKERNIFNIKKNLYL